MSKKSDNALDGRKLWIPRMTYIGARMMAAVFRSVGIDADVTPPSDEKTLELGGLYTSGEECYPEKVTLGDFLKIVHSKDFDPSRHAFFMPTAEGPCRFGQYAPYMRQVLREMGYEQVPVVSPTSKNGYDGFSDHAGDMVRQLWRGMVAADILRKMLLKTRPYEIADLLVSKGGPADRELRVAAVRAVAAPNAELNDKSGKSVSELTSQPVNQLTNSELVYEGAMQLLQKVLEQHGTKPADRMAAIIEALVKSRDMFHTVPARYTRDKPLIGVVGEIFCRLNTFSNYDAVRKIEAHGGEAWLSDVTEWVWYTNWSQKSLLKRDGKTISLSMLGAVVKNAVQKRDEHRLLEPFKDDFVGYEEPHDVYEDVLKPGWPYLPGDGALGEMALSVGKSVYLYEKGADGIIDISPFSCMNGIVSEAVYHALAHEHDDIPIRNFYFDASSSNMERDLDIFMELARGYQKRKTRHRRYGPLFK